MFFSTTKFSCKKYNYVQYTDGMGGGFGQNVFQKSVSTQIRGDTKIETTTEIKNGVKTQTVKQTNMKTGATLTNINQIGI